MDDLIIMSDALRDRVSIEDIERQLLNDDRANVNDTGAINGWTCVITTADETIERYPIGLFSRADDACTVTLIVDPVHAGKIACSKIKTIDLAVNDTSIVSAAISDSLNIEYNGRMIVLSFNVA